MLEPQEQINSGITLAGSTLQKGAQGYTNSALKAPRAVVLSQWVAVPLEMDGVLYTDKAKGKPLPSFRS